MFQVVQVVAYKSERRKLTLDDNRKTDANINYATITLITLEQTTFNTHMLLKTTSRYHR